MDSKLLIIPDSPNFLSPIRQLPCLQLCRKIPFVSRTFHYPNNNTCSLRFRRSFSAAAANGSALTSTSTSSRNGVYTVGDFMTKKEDLVVVKPSTTVDEALETLVEYRITGFPVINDDWELVGVVSDYDLLALDSISVLFNFESVQIGPTFLSEGTGQADASMFPEVGSTWKVFNEIQILLSKTNGKLVSDVMTQVPVVVRETTNLEDAARLLLETRYRRLPIVNADGKLVGIITRGNVIRAALHIKRENEKKAS